MATATAVGPAPEVFTDEVLRILTAATWPDGSALVDVDDEVLRRTVAPQIEAVVRVFAASAALSAHASIGCLR